MLWTLFRKIDMRLGLTWRGRLAPCIATSTHMEPLLAYEGAVHMLLDDWLPELCVGEPLPTLDSAAEFHVVQARDEDARIHGFCARFNRDTNAWIDETGKVFAPRGANDRWILAADHNAAFARAAQRAKDRLAHGLSVRFSVSLMWRYQRATTIMLALASQGVAICALRLLRAVGEAFFASQPDLPEGFGMELAEVVFAAIVLIALARIVLGMAMRTAVPNKGAGGAAADGT